MNQRRIDWIAAGALFVVALVTYLYTCSPTVAFWDVGEFIACSVNLGVPHPPGTPLYVLIGRIFSLLPLSAETAFRINFISVLTAALSVGMVVLVTSRVVRTFKKEGEKETTKLMKWLPTAVGVVGAVFTMFAFSVWENALEAEVYAPSAFLGLLIVYLAVLWRERTERRAAAGVDPERLPKADNRLMLMAFYVILLAAGLHLTPVMMLFALIPFILLVNHRLLPTFFLGVLGLSFMLFEPGWPQIAVVALFVIYFFTQGGKTRGGYGPAFWFLGAYLLLIVLALLKAGTAITVGGVVVLVAAFFYAARKYQVDLKFFLLGLAVLIIAASVQLYLMIRAQQHPSINMVNPSNWERFLSVLRREQYGRATVQSQLWPRKTVVHPDTGQPTGVGVIAGFFWQFALYFKYFFWQWGLKDLAGKPAVVVIGRTLLAAVPVILGVFGLYSLAKRDRKLFWLLLTTFLIASFGLVIYLNMRFGHSGPLPKDMSGLPQEVRERDYFFTFSYAFWGLFTGFGVYELVMGFKRAFNGFMRRAISAGTSILALLLAVLIGITNFPMASRRGDWIPLEYGFNLLASCREPSVIFTNGDNDTFPLWFVQEVPSTKYENNHKPYKAGVINANLSLLNTPWYIAHLKRKGAPISFVYESRGEKLTLAKRSQTLPTGGTSLVWEAYVAHPPIKERTLKLNFKGTRFTEGSKGKLRGPTRKLAGRVEHKTGRVVLYLEALDSPAREVTLTADYGSGEIDNLPSHVFVTRQRVVMLADIMIRDMVATNAGIRYSESEKVSISGFSTKIPLDYLIPAGEFVKKVLTRYEEQVMPVYLSTTVSPGKVSDYAPGLVQEALAYRFRPASLEDTARTRPAINVNRSYELMSDTFKMESILDPDVNRDEQAKGLFVNYGVAMMEVAEGMVRQGRPQEAYDFVKVIDDFEVGKDVRRVFLSNLYVFARQAGEPQDAQRYFQEMKEKGWLGTRFHINQAVGYMRAGDTDLAEQEFKQAYSQSNRENPQGFLSLFMFYLETRKDTARAEELLTAWDQRYSGHQLSFRLYLDYLNQPREALRVLNYLIRAHPNEQMLLRLRDSIVRTYNL